MPEILECVITYRISKSYNKFRRFWINFLIRAKFFDHIETVYFCGLKPYMNYDQKFKVNKIFRR